MQTFCPRISLSFVGSDVRCVATIKSISPICLNTILSACVPSEVSGDPKRPASSIAGWRAAADWRRLLLCACCRPAYRGGMPRGDRERPARRSGRASILFSSFSLRVEVGTSDAGQRSETARSMSGQCFIPPFQQPSDKVVPPPLRLSADGGHKTDGVDLR